LVNRKTSIWVEGVVIVLIMPFSSFYKPPESKAIISAV